MEHLYQTFLHSVAWHAGTNFANSIGMPIMFIFIGYGVYKVLRRR